MPSQNCTTNIFLIQISKSWCHALNQIGFCSLTFTGSLARTAGESKKWQFLQSETYFTVSTVKHHVTWHHLVILIEAWKCLLKKRPSILDETKVPRLFRCGRKSLPPYVICKKTYCVCHRFQKLLCILCTICDWTRPKRGEHRFN